MSKNSCKLSTGIDGLDKLFFGGIHVEMNTDTSKDNNGNKNNLVIAIRGNRSVKKFYLGLPLCKALCDNIGKEEWGAGKASLIFSLSKTSERLLNIFCNSFIQDIIRKIQIESEYLKIYNDSLKGCICINNRRGAKGLEFHTVIEKQLNLISKGEYGGKTDEIICLAIRDGLIYYNERTQHFHIRRPKRNDDNDRTKILKIDAKKLAKSHQMMFYGKDELLKEEECSNNLVLFHRLIHMLNEKEKFGAFYSCIFIDGLSRLTDKDMEQCPFDALIDIIHNKCSIGILTMDERLSISKINPDIVLEMRSRLDEKYNITCRELCISKCLHQQHAYGWHTYKLRNYGIEVIPSVHKILYRRNYMDNAVPEALLPISRPSYRYWLEESVGESKIYDITDNDSRTENNCIANLRKNYYELYDLRKGKDDLYETIEQGCIKVFFGKKEDPDEPIRAILSNIYEKSKMYDHHVLFIDFSRSRKDFWKIINKFKYTGRSENIHFFGIRYGCLFSDELLYTIEQQVDALAKHIRGKDISKPLYHWYHNIHVIMGDMSFLEFGHPSLYDDNLLLPAYVDLTKGNYMQNYLYINGGSEKLKNMMSYAADY